MSHAPCLSILSMLLLFFSAQQLLWNMGPEFTKYDRTVGYVRPLQLPWPNQVTILNNCMVSHTALIGEICPSVPLWRTDSHPFSFLTPLLSILLPFTLQSDPWTVACRSLNVRGFLTSFTVACGGGRTSTATTSYVPLRPVSMPSTSKRMRCASTLTTTKG